MTPISGIYVALAIITLILHLLNYRSNEPQWKFITLYLILTLVTSAAAISVAELTVEKNNLYIFHLFTPLEYVILALLYHSVFHNTSIRRLIRQSIPIFFIGSILLSAFVQPLNVNNSYSIILESVLIALWSLLFLRETILLQREPRLQRFPMFWISIGLLFYFTGGLFVEGMMNHLINQSPDLARKAYKMSFIFKYLLFLLFMVGATCRSMFKINSNESVL